MMRLVGRKPMVKCHLDGKKFDMLWDTGSMICLVDRKWVGEHFPDKEIDTAERDKEELKSPNKLKSSFKALDSITTLKVEAKDSKVEDTVIHKIDDESDTPDDEQIDTNIVLGDSDEYLEDNERNNLNSKSAKKNSAKSNQSLGNSWNVPGDRSERGDEFDTEIDTAERDKE